MPYFTTLFSKAALAEKGQLELTALDKYIHFSASKKKAIMNEITESWQESLVIVNAGDKRELWVWNIKKSNAELVEEWSLDIKQVKVPEKSYNHLFSSIGFMLSNDKLKLSNISLYINVGCFLLVNRLDLSASFTNVTTKISGSESSSYRTISVMSRFHFPIRKIGLSPNIGSGIAYSNGTFSPQLSTGISWFIGFGSLDFEIRIAKEFSGMIGYTISPKFKSKKRK